MTAFSDYLANWVPILQFLRAHTQLYRDPREPEVIQKADSRLARGGKLSPQVECWVMDIYLRGSFLSDWVQPPADMIDRYIQQRNERARMYPPRHYGRYGRGYYDEH